MTDFFTNSLFFAAVLSIASYLIGLFIRDKTGLTVLNPLLIAVIITSAVLLLTGTHYSVYNSSAKYLSYLLTPATVCFAVPLYEQLSLLRKNLAAVLAGTLSGVITSFVSVLIFSWVFGLSRAHSVTLLPKSVTMAIGVELSREYGGNSSVTAVVIILTGIFGSIITPAVCKWLRIDTSLAKGMAFGCASHSVGTARALEYSSAQGAASSLALVLSGLITVPGVMLTARLVL